MNSIQQFQINSLLFKGEVQRCIDNCMVFDYNRLPEGEYPDGYVTNVSVLDCTVQDAINLFKDTPLAVLSFSCKRNPAGESKTSMLGQEADMSRISLLPTVLKSDKLLLQYYLRNRETDSFAGDLVAYLPGVPFFFDGACSCIDIISCAAPSTKYLHKYSKDRLRVHLERRIDIILSSALCQGKRNIILGAWGCGGNGLDAAVVATAFKSVIDTGYSDVFENIIFAIPDTGMDHNYNTFKSIIGGDGY